MNEVEYIAMYEAEDTHWWYVSLHSLILQQMPRMMRKLRILDAGCGTGRLLQLLSATSAIEGCDVSETALSLCRKRGLTAITHTDLNRVTLEHDRYDVITSIDVLYHREVKDDGAVLREMYSALKPGGLLILQVPAYEWLRSRHDDAVHTGRRYTRPKIEQLVTSCGFTIEKTTYRVTLLFVPIALARLAKNLVRRHSTEREAASDVKRHSVAVNAALLKVMKIENRLLRRFSLPFGASVFTIARKPGGLGDKNR